MDRIAKFLENHGQDIITIQKEFVVVLGEYCQDGKTGNTIDFIDSMRSARNYMGY